MEGAIDIIKIISRGWKPHSDNDVIIVGIFVFIFLLLVVGFIKRTFKIEKYNKITLCICLMAPIFYVLFVIFIIPRLNKLDNDKIGVIVTNFTGTDLGDNFGSSGFEPYLENLLQHNLGMLGLNDFMQYKILSYEVNSTTEAKKLLEKYSAKCLIWGNISRFDSIISISTNIEYANWGFKIISMDGYSNTNWIQLTRFEPIDIKPDGKELRENLANMIDNICIDLIPMLGSNIVNTNPEYYSRLTDSIISMDIYDSNTKLHPMIMFMAAQANAQSKKYENSLKCYIETYDACCIEANKQDSISELNTYDKINYQQIASACKMEEAITHLLNEDTASAIECVITASLLDSNLRRDAISIILALKPESLSDYVVELPDCFKYAQNDGLNDSAGPYYRLKYERVPIKR